MDEPVLVLNANFEPIHVCDIRRAMGLIMAERASLVMNGRGEIKIDQRRFSPAFHHPAETIDPPSPPMRQTVPP